MTNGTNSVPRPKAFVPFDEARAVRIYQRNLPHWRQSSGTYFVTFRLNDSIADAIRQQWEEEQKLWLQAHGIKYDGSRGTWRKALERLPKAEQWRFQQHFNRQVQACLDRGLGERSLRRGDCLAVVRQKLLGADGDVYHLGDFVIMANHVHALITPVTSERDERNEFRSTELEVILKKIKGSTAVECNRLLGRSGAFWQADSYDHIVRSLEQLHSYREYIVENPSKAGVAVPASALYRADWMDAWFEA